MTRSALAPPFCFRPSRALPRSCIGRPRRDLAAPLGSRPTSHVLLFGAQLGRVLPGPFRVRTHLAFVPPLCVRPRRAPSPSSHAWPRRARPPSIRLSACNERALLLRLRHHRATPLRSLQPAVVSMFTWSVNNATAHVLASYERGPAAPLSPHFCVRSRRAPRRSLNARPRRDLAAPLGARSRLAFDLPFHGRSQRWHVLLFSTQRGRALPAPFRVRTHHAFVPPLCGRPRRAPSPLVPCMAPARTSAFNQCIGMQ